MMARPKKDLASGGVGGGGDDTPMTVSYGSYMQMAEFVSSIPTQHIAKFATPTRNLKFSSLLPQP